MNTIKTKALIAFLFFPLSLSASLVTNLHFYSGIAAKAGYSYFIEGCGFLDGDKLRLEDTTQTYTFLLDLTVVNNDTVKFLFPDGLHSGEHKMTLVRGDMTEELGTTCFQIVEEMPKGSSVIAHRGYWIKPGASQNSRASLQNAIDLEIYGSETDIWLTSDGYLICNHDADYDGVNIESSSFEQVKNIKISNGETMPTLAELLDMLKNESPTKLIIEIKPHSDRERNYAVADSTLLLVHRMGLEDKVEYISFSIYVCRRLVEMDSFARVAYLSGNKTPQELYQEGINGLDYTRANYLDNPEWLDDAHNLSMSTNVWTIDNMDDIIEMNNLGVDYITTNYPERAMEIQNYYQKVWTDYENTNTPIRNIETDKNTNIRVYSIFGIRQKSIMRGKINIIENNGKYRKIYRK